MRFIVTASALVFFAVLLGALGAHALAETLANSGRTSAWETAVLYHIAHGLALFAAGIWRVCDPRARHATSVAVAGTLWIIGTILFSGSLYVLCLGGPSWLGPVTPLGGLCLMGGWIALAAGTIRIMRTDARA